MLDLPNTLTLSKEATSALSRSHVYSFLARVFSYPKEPLPDYWALAQDSFVALELTDLASALAPLKPICQSLEDIQGQYLLVFTHSMNPDYPPYEMEYGHTSLYQQSAGLGDIAAFYRSCGVEAASGERLDHIGAELEFMYFLAFKEAYAWQNHGEEKAGLCHDIQKKFLETHLGCWAPLFLNLVQRKSPSPFYQELASISRNFLAEDVKLLDAHPHLLAETDFRPGFSGLKNEPVWGEEGCFEDCV